jgi:HK97 family phage portal protein
MSLLSNIRERIAYAIQPQKNKNPNARGRSDRSVGSVYSGNELDASLRGTVFACLQQRANALANLSFEVYSEKDYKIEELPRSHWAKELLANPNPYFTRSQVFSYIENWLSINGNCFIWTPTNGYRVPLQMWALNPTRVRVIKGSDNFIDGYIYQSAQEGNIAIPEKEMIHLARIHPAARQEEIVGMNMFGVGLVQAAMQYANIDKEISAYLARLFKNNTVPPLIAKYPERFDYDEWERLKSRWNEELPDYKLRGLLAGGLSLELPPKGELSINYDSISSDTRAQIAQVFGVPPGMLNGEYQNRATAEVQWAIFRQNTIDPEALYISEEFTRHFKRWDDSLLVEAERFVYDDPLVDLQKEEFELKWGIKTINESRKERGYDIISGGDVALIGNGFVPLGAIPPPINETENRGIVKKKDSEEITEAGLLQNAVNSRINPSGESELEILTSDIKDYFWRKYDGLTEKNAISIKRVVDSAFMEIQKDILERVGIGGTDISDISITPEQISKYQNAVNESCQVIKRELAKELGVEVDKLPPAINNYISGVTQESGNKISESIGAIKTEVQSELVKLSGEEPSVIEKALKARFNTLLPSRAKTIANTTSANATSAVQYTMYRENGFKSVWLTQRDGKVRPSHLSVDGQYPNESGYFIVGGEQTTRPLGDGLSARNAVNCRCQLFPER